MSLTIHLSKFLLVILLSLFLLITLNPAIAEQDIQIKFPRAKITEKEHAVIYLQGNRQSEAVAKYYQTQRNIPDENIFSIWLSSTNTHVSPKEFILLKQQLDEKLPTHIQALVLTWAQPYQVGCMSISSAFAFGYNEEYCAQSCEKTKPNQYHNSHTTEPYKNYAIRPTMMLAANNIEYAKALIDRGISADNTRPVGNAYLLNTNDYNRSVRHIFFDEVKKRFSSKFNIHLLNQNSIKHKNNILFYFTGLPSVPNIETLSYLPGAIADHLTSAGGRLTNSTQMSAMKWLEAGATGSYGAAIEPCNFTQKFPNPVIVMTYYTRGSSLIEAYWKSVLMPGQGNFIGEPLAAPFSGYELIANEDHIEVHAPMLYRGTYSLSTKLNGKLIESTQTISKHESFLKISPPYQSKYHVTRIEQ